MGIARNGIAEISFNGEKMQALRQGMLGFWAFPFRSKLDKDLLKEIDEMLDAALEAFDKKQRGRK